MNLPHQITVTEPRICEIQDHRIRLGMLCGNLPSDQNLQQLRQRIPLTHHRRLLLIQRVKDLPPRRLPLLEHRLHMRIRRHHRNHGLNPIRLRHRLQLRQQQQGEQEGRHHVRRQRALVAPDGHERARRDAGALEHDVDAGQPGAAGRELLDRLVVLEVEGPDFEDAGAVGAGFDGAGGFFAFGEAAAADDDFGRVQPGVVARGFEAEPGVGACDDDGLTGEVGGERGDGREPLALEEVDPELEAGHGFGIVESQR